MPAVQPSLRDCSLRGRSTQDFIPAAQAAVPSVLRLPGEKCRLKSGKYNCRSENKLEGDLQLSCSICRGTDGSKRASIVEIVGWCTKNNIIEGIKSLQPKDK
jgi:hypothetical protein